MFNSDISNDYSFLMHNIEGKMSSAATSSSRVAPQTAPTTSATPSASTKLNTLTAARENIAANTGLKRKRLAEIHNDDSEDEQFMASLRNSTTSTTTGRSSSATLKLQAQLDEYKILNEQLKEQLRSYKDEHELFKEQSIRQLKYLEESSGRYKTQYEQTSTKYYKEKKEWQSRTRELDHAVQQLRQQLAAAQVGETHGSSGSRVINSRIFDHSVDEDLQQELLDLKEKFIEKQKEASGLLAEKLELEKKVFKIEQESKTLKSVAQGSEDDAAEVRALRKKCNDLETILRRKSKEYEKYDQKLKNQIMLEEELATVQQKLALAQNTLKTYHNMEVNYGKYQEEKKVWSQLFSTILKDSSNLEAEGKSLSIHPAVDENSAQSNNNGTVDDCTPTKVLNMFSDLQKKHLLLIQQHKDTELNAVQLRRQLLKAESQNRELQQENQSMKDCNEKLQLKITTMTKQSKCFDGEISSLRSLLKTFDAEFSIGKPDAAKILSLKESVIQGLREELDSARKVVTEYSQKISSLETDLENAVATATKAPQMTEVAGHLEKEIEELKADYDALQEITGMDFLPHKTQVLHLAQNPSSILKSRPGYEERCTLPMDVLKHLKSQVQSLSKKIPASENRNSAQSTQPSDISMMIDHQLNAGNKSSSTVDPNKMNQRLKEIFKEKISTFREAVYMLTGFKMDLTSADPNNPKSLPHVKLRSMYAETPEDALVFQLRDDTAELLETDFANNLDPSLVMYLTNYNSVPAFLAALTLQLFESQTQM